MSENERTTSEAETDVSLREVAAILRRRKGAIAGSIVACVAVALTLSIFLPKRWAAEAQMILMEESGDGRRWAASPLLTSLHLGEPMIETPDTQVAMIQSPEMCRRTMAWLQADATSRGKAAVSCLEAFAADPNLLARKIRVVNPKNTNLLTVSVDAPTPEASVAVTNALCAAFIQWKRELAQQSADETVHSLGIRTDRAQRDLRQDEQHLTEFMQRGQVVEIDAQNKTLLSQLAARDNDVSTLQQELSAARDREAGLQARAAQTDAAIRGGGAVRDDDRVISLQAQLQDLEIERDGAAHKYTTAYPGVLPEMDAKIRDLRERLARAIQGSVDGSRPSLATQKLLADSLQDAHLATTTIEQKLRIAQSQRDQVKALAVAQPAKESAYARLSAEVDLARSLYTDLASRLNSARAGRDMITSNIRIVQPATLADQPKFPRLGLNLALGVVIGLFVSAVTALLLEQSDPRLRTAEEAAALLPGPVLATVPQFSRADIAALARGTGPSFAADAFGLARANLSLLWRSEGARARVVLVTSAVPEEGKSTTASEIARAFARTSESVVLVEADLRRPSRHRDRTGGDHPGLTDVLEGRAALSQALTPTSLPNLSILESGGPVADAAPLIASTRMAEVLKALRSEAHTVVVDTPAGAVVPDALLLAPHADCIVQVVGIGVADTDSVRGILRALEAAAPRHLAFLINRAPRDRARERRYRATYGTPLSRHASGGSGLVTAAGRGASGEENK